MTRDLAHWETYYRGGSVVSCPMGDVGGYDHEIRAAWEAFFRQLPPGARIVDLCTGNGAVPLIAREVATALGRDFEIHGVDLARIDPFRDVAEAGRRLEGVQFHPGVAAESLPFENESVDALTSQYGLEYTDAPRTLSEAARVLRRGGRAQFIAHHDQSIVISKARATLELGELALNKLRLFDATRSYFYAERHDPALAETLRTRLAELSGQLRGAAAAAIESQFADMTLAWLARAFETRTTGLLMDALRQVDAIEQVMRDWLQRMSDLVSVAWTADDVERVQRQAAEAGLVIGPAEAQRHRQSNLVGWRLEFSK